MFETKNGSKFKSGKDGGWYFTVNGSDSQMEFVQQHYLLDGDMGNGVGKVHISAENIINLQNFCKLNNVKFVHQFFLSYKYIKMSNKQYEINFLLNPCTQKEDDSEYSSDTEEYIRILESCIQTMAPTLKKPVGIKTRDLKPVGITSPTL